MKNKKSSKEESLEELVDEKNSKKPVHKDSEDEEEFLEEEETLDDFVDDIFIDIDSSPSLEKVAVSSGTRLENQIFVSSSQNEDSVDDDSFRYDLVKKDDEEKKYASYEAVVEATGIDMEHLGRDVFSDTGKKVDFVSSMKNGDGKKYEEKYEARNIDVENLGRENPFEKKEKKYNEKPKSF